MQLTLELDGEKVPVEVDLDRGTVRVGDRTYPFRVVSEKNGRTELEIAGEKVVVDGWPVGLREAPRSLAVDGENRTVRVERAAGAPAIARSRPLPTLEPAAGSPALEPSSSTDGGGSPVFPPMPGRVIEVRVAEGDHVSRGQVLLVLEAMKMRNEVPAPTTGVVRGVVVRPGTNVRAREPMLRIVPDFSP